jgi:hypothetical protein
MDATFRTNGGTVVWVRTSPVGSMSRWNEDTDGAQLPNLFGDTPPVAGADRPGTRVVATPEEHGLARVGVVRSGRRPVMLQVMVLDGPPIDTTTVARFGAGLAGHGQSELLAGAADVPCGEVNCGP